MTEFKAGQRVHVEFEGEILSLLDHDGCLKILDDDEEAGGFNHYVYANSEAVKITPADPKDWPPQVGDIWEADGAGKVKEFYVRQNRDDPRKVVFVAEDGYMDFHRLEPFKALNPVLVRRRG